jgi:hypothetical protein
MRAVLIAIFVAASAPSMALGQFKDGNKLYSDCTSREGDFYGKASCLNFILGSFDAIYYLQNEGHMNRGTCPPDNIVGGQLVDIVTSYLRSNPAYRSSAAFELTFAALVLAFPCRK